jgi:hypothetical protein
MATQAKPKTAPKNVPVQTSVKKVLAALGDEQAQEDSKALIEMMKRITGKTPKIWNVGTIGFDTYHYKYESGREGDCHVLGFYPRKGKFTIYLMDGTARYSALLEKLGKHTTSMACVYFKRLSDIQLPVLEKILEQSHKYLKAQDGQMHRMEK